MRVAQREHPMMASLEKLIVKDVMHPGVLHCPPETPLKIVARMMAANKVHSVVVFGDPTNYNDEKAWRIVSDVDLIGFALFDVTSRTAAEAATGEVLTVFPSDPISRAAEVMSDNATSHLIVIDEEREEPVGIVSTLDIAFALAWSSVPTSKA